MATFLPITRLLLLPDLDVGEKEEREAAVADRGRGEGGEERLDEKNGKKIS